ncbi:hypothetical protein [Leptospira santarosai]|uniref:hypothetical protein n=1 Tax=Leptospira santarosai TaxID=28183 RepID=UPI000774B32D
MQIVIMNFQWCGRRSESSVPKSIRTYYSQFWDLRFKKRRAYIALPNLKKRNSKVVGPEVAKNTIFVAVR